MIYISKRTDRIGMRLYATIRTIYYCQKQNLIYRHVLIGHNNNDYKEYDKLFNFDKKYKTITNKKNLKKNKNIKNIGNKWGLFKAENDDYKTKKFIKYRNSLINLYKKSNLYKNIYNINEINICVHYRRGDCDNFNKTNGNKYQIQKRRYTPDNYINQIITKLNKYMNDLPINIHIHSDSTLNISNLIKCKHNFNIHTHFDDSVFKSLNCMIQCDILFRYGLSSFSGVAAFYNTNVVISNMGNEFNDLYNYNNVYNFSKCGNILRKLSKKYKVMNKSI